MFRRKNDSPRTDGGFSFANLVNEQPALGNAQEVAALAERLLLDPLLPRLFDELEAEAMRLCIYTENDFTREAKAAEVRAIRALRQKLNALLSEANLPRRGAPA